MVAACLAWTWSTIPDCALDSNFWGNSGIQAADLSAPSSWHSIKLLWSTMADLHSYQCPSCSVNSNSAVPHWLRCSAAPGRSGLSLFHSPCWTFASSGTMRELANSWKSTDLGDWRSSWCHFQCQHLFDCSTSTNYSSGKIGLVSRRYCRLHHISGGCHPYSMSAGSWARTIRSWRVFAG